MKKQLLFLFSAGLVFFSLKSNAQNRYAFSKTTGVYNDLTGSAVITPASWTEADLDTIISLPFNFSFFDSVYNQINVVSRGIIIPDVNSMMAGKGGALSAN